MYVDFNPDYVNCDAIEHPCSYDHVYCTDNVWSPTYHFIVFFPVSMLNLGSTVTALTTNAGTLTIILCILAFFPRGEISNKKSRWGCIVTVKYTKWLSFLEPPIFFSNGITFSFLNSTYPPTAENHRYLQDISALSCCNLFLNCWLT